MGREWITISFFMNDRCQFCHFLMTAVEESGKPVGNIFF